MDKTCNQRHGEEQGIDPIRNKRESRDRGCEEQRKAWS